MTVEEALVALLAAVAGVLLYIGLAQALGDDRGGPDAVDETQRRRGEAPRSAARRAADRPEGSLRRSPQVLSGDTEG